MNSEPLEVPHISSIQMASLQLASYSTCSLMNQTSMFCVAKSFSATASSAIYLIQAVTFFSWTSASLNISSGPAHAVSGASMAASTTFSPWS